MANAKPKKKARKQWVYVGPIKPERVYQVKITIAGSRPPIWRRLLMREDASFEEMHAAIQMAFGWTNSHLHEFVVGHRRFMPRFEDGFDPMFEDDVEDERTVRLSDLRLKAKSKLLYTYDMGDNWEHLILVEKVLPIDEAESLMSKATGQNFTRQTRTPNSVCIGGERAGPLEDCGGIGGYEETCQILADPKHPEHTERSEWATGFASNCIGEGVRFDPEFFDLKGVNKVMQKYLTR